MACLNDYLGLISHHIRALGNFHFYTGCVPRTVKHDHNYEACHPKKRGNDYRIGLTVVVLESCV